MTRVLLITSGKGGVGKTTTAVNLAHSLYSYGRRVVLLDLNLYSADVNLHLGAFRADKTLHDLLEGNAKEEDVLYTHNSGLIFIPGSVALNKTKKIDADKVKEGVDKILKFLDKRSEVVVIDAGIIFMNHVKNLLDKVTDIILVTTPDKESVVNTLKASKLAEEKGKNIVGVVVNKVKGNKVEMTSEEIEKFIEQPVLVEIPHDEEVMYAQRLEFPVTHYKPDANVSVKFRELASKLIGKSYAEKLAKEEKESLFLKILKSLGLAK